MTAASWVALAPVVDPLVAWLIEGVGFDVTFERAPEDHTGPFAVLILVSDPRTILTLDGGVPADVTWQVDTVGATPLLALGAADRVSARMCVEAAPDLPGVLVRGREAVGVARGDRLGDRRYVRQQQFRWTLIAATTP